MKVDTSLVATLDAGENTGGVRRPARPRLVDVSQRTAGDLAHRRRWFLLPSCLGAGVLLTRTLTNGGPWWTGPAVLLATGVICAAGLVAVTARDRAAARRLAGTYAFATFGRFAFTDAASQPSLAPAVTGVDRGRLDLTRGLLEGTVAIGPHHLLFAPGRIATKAGAGGIVWPWDSIESVEVVPRRFALGSGMRLRFRDGAVLDVEVRGHGRLSAALTAVLGNG